MAKPKDEKEEPIDSPPFDTSENDDEEENGGGEENEENEETGDQLNG